MTEAREIYDEESRTAHFGLHGMGKAKDVRLTVRARRAGDLRARFWAGALVIRLGAWLAGLSYKQGRVV